jgi:RNA polymerase sigma-70 factor, ECF subfamily
MDVSDRDSAAEDQGATLLALYDSALPQVYGYLLPRCNSEAVAEDLSAETFLAAVDAVQRNAVPNLSVAWLMAVARNKLVDYWRRQSPEQRGLRRAAAEVPVESGSWDERIDAERARAALARLRPQHQAALSLRYLDGLSVPDAARHLGRTVHATEALLVRARAAFRRAYAEEGNDGWS